MPKVTPFRQGEWKPVPSHRDDRGIIKVVWLQGTPYEMGYQHGKLLHDEIDSMPRILLDTLSFLGRHLGLAKFAKRWSFSDVIQECEGLVAATRDVGMTMDNCLVLAFGDVFQEFFADSLPKIFNDGCSQFVATGKATVDGHLYHGRSLDNNGKPVDYWLKNSTVFVRQPNDGIPHVFVAVPGVVWPNSGMNAAGISIGLNTAHPKSIGKLSTAGRSHVQMMGQILKHATTYDEAKTYMKSQRRIAADLIMITDGGSRKAGVFELTGQKMGIRELDSSGVLDMPNHFLSPEMKDEDRDPPTKSSPVRHDRFVQLLQPGGPHSLHGKIDTSVMVKILRDRINPYTLQASPLDIYDDNASIASNGVLRQEVFDPKRLLFWVAAGDVPVPANPFVGFSLGEMLNLPDAVLCRPSVFR